MANTAIENALGTVGTILWTVQLLPQVYKSWRTKSTEGLSGALMLIWSISAVFLGVYVIVQDLNIPLILQPQLFGALAAFSWIQCLHYGQKRSTTVCAIIFLLYLAIFAGFETGMTYAVRFYGQWSQIRAPSNTMHLFCVTSASAALLTACLQFANHKGHDGVVKGFGIISAVLISAGLIPQYIEIWKRKEVIGISLTFMAVDMLGGIFSCLSLAFRPEFDGVAAATYVAVVVLDGVIVLAAIILNPRAKRKRFSEEQEPSPTVSPTMLPPSNPLQICTNLSAPPMMRQRSHDSLPTTLASPIPTSPYVGRQSEDEAASPTVGGCEHEHDIACQSKTLGDLSYESWKKTKPDDPEPSVDETQHSRKWVAGDIP